MCFKVLFGLLVVPHNEGEEGATPVVNTGVLDWDLEEQLQALGRQGEITRNKIMQTGGHKGVK